MAQKIGQTFKNSTKKNQLVISNGSGVINVLMKRKNDILRSKTMTDKC
jgi:hypothetical protein